MKNKTPKQRVLFQDLFDRRTEIQFDQQTASSDGGLILAARAEANFGLAEKLAECLAPKRAESKIVHRADKILRQRILGLVCGYRDCNDAARLSEDPLFSIAASGAVGEAGPASQPTLSRFENSVSVRELARMGRALVETALGFRSRRERRETRRVIIDMDPTVDPAHGEQQLTFYSGFHGTRCYKPVTVFMQTDRDPEQYLLTAVLRPGNAPDQRGACSILRRLIPRVKAAFPHAEIRVRLDGGFACVEVLRLLESWKYVKYAVNMPKNSVLKKRATTALRKAGRKFNKSGHAEREYAEFHYRAEKWKRYRRMLLKAEIVRYPGREPRENPRFLITNMKQSPKFIYESFYSGRGDAENRIKELKNSLALDRTSCNRFTANQFRVLLSTAAYMILQQIRRCAAGTRFARAQAPRLIEQLIKLSARVTVSVRRILIQLPESAVARDDWVAIATALDPS